MNKRLYHILDLDDTHQHITKKIITTSNKKHSDLLRMLEKRNSYLQDDINCYHNQHKQRAPKQLPELETKTNQEKLVVSIKKKRMELALSRGRLDIISNLLKSDKKKDSSREDRSLIDLFSKKKPSRKELQVTKFNINQPVQNEQQPSKLPYLHSQNSQKQNRSKSPVYRFRPFQLRNGIQNPALNSIRYSTLLRTINNNQRSCYNYSTKLPQIPINRKLQSGKSAFKRVQFA